MIQIDKSDFLYKTLQKLGVEDGDIDNEYMIYANDGISNIKDFNNHIEASLGMDYLGEIDENCLEPVLDYYKDLKSIKCPSQSKTTALLKQYKQNPSESLRLDIINSELKEVLLIACAYKMRNSDANLSDIVQIGNIALMKAIDKYDENSKLTFQTYLNYWILKDIEDFTKGEQNG